MTNYQKLGQIALILAHVMRISNIMAQKNQVIMSSFKEFDPGLILKIFKWTTFRPRGQHHMGYQATTFKKTKVINGEDAFTQYNEEPMAAHAASTML